MGTESNITATTFPKQGPYAGVRARVSFDYDSSQIIEGTFVREDAEAPGRAIIRLDDGRHVLSTECQWQPIRGDCPECDPPGSGKECRGGKCARCNGTGRVDVMAEAYGTPTAADVLRYLDYFAGQEDEAEQVRDFVQKAAMFIAERKTRAEWLAEAEFEQLINWIEGTEQ